MKRILDKKLPMLFLCCFVITGMVLTSTPAFSRDGNSSYNNGRTDNRDSSRDRDSYHDRDNDRDRDNSRDRYQSKDRDKSRDRYDSHRKNNSRPVTVIKKNDVIPAIIATGIIAGVTFSLLDSHNTPAVQTVVPSTCPAYGGGVAAAGSVMVTAELLNIRSGPGLHKSCVGQIRRGSTLSIMSTSAGWYYVMTTGGVSGWVMAQYVTPVGYPVSG